VIGLRGLNADARKLIAAVPPLLQKSTDDSLETRRFLFFGFVNRRITISNHFQT
jgi:hypothetical protein